MRNFFVNYIRKLSLLPVLFFSANEIYLEHEDESGITRQCLETKKQFNYFNVQMLSVFSKRY